jgi:TPR repeat protein
VGTGSHEENASNKTLEPGSDAIRTDKALVANFKEASNPNSRGAACAERVKKAVAYPWAGEGMRKPALIGAIAAMLLVGTAGAQAGPWEDGMVAYNRGDYVPAIRLFRPLAEQGNPKAQAQIGTMYRKGEGTASSPTRAFMWFSLAAKRGDAKAKAGLREVSRVMTPAEMSQAQAMAEACAASNYRACEY